MMWAPRVPASGRHGSPIEPGEAAHLVGEAPGCGAGDADVADDRAEATLLLGKERVLPQMHTNRSYVWAAMEMTIAGPALSNALLPADPRLVLRDEALQLTTCMD